MILNSPYISGSLTVTGNIIASGSITLSGSVASSSYALNSTNASSASYVDYNSVANKPSLVSSSQQILDYNIFATTGSNTFVGTQTVTGSLNVNGNVTATGQIIAQTLNVQQVTSSVVYSSGSNVFGNNISNTHQFTGSVLVTGSVSVNGALSGTIATFNSSVNITKDGSNSAAAGPYYLWQNTAITRQWWAQLNASNEIDWWYFNGSTSTVKQTIKSDGGLNLTGTLSGTSLSMSGTISQTGPTQQIVQGSVVSIDRNSTTGALTLSTNASHIILSPAANVGIGTTNPSSLLHLYNSNSNVQLRVQSDLDQAGLRLIAGSAGTNRASRVDFLNGNASTTVPRWTIINDYSQNGTNDFSIVNSDPSNRVFVINQSGAASFASDVTLNNGTILISANSGALYTTRISTAYNFPYVDSYFDSYAGASYEGRINFRTNSGGGAMGTRVTILNNGNVGIGKTGPNTTLDVNGTTASGIFTCAYQLHGIKVMSFDAASSVTVNLPTEFPQALLVNGNTWAVFGKCNLFGSGGSVEVREFCIGRTATGTWSTANYGPSSNTVAALVSVTGSGNSITINMNSGTYLIVELTVMVR